MNNEEKKQIIHTIKNIQFLEDYHNPDEELKLLLTSSAFVTGVLGLLTFCASYTNGSLAVGATVLTGIPGVTLLGSLIAYIKQRIKAKSEVKKFREKNNLTEEKQKEFLEELVATGDKTAINLYNYFYNKEKGKSLWLK